MTNAIQPLKPGKNTVEFYSDGLKLVGNLYCPEDFNSEKTYPAVVVGGPMATVKEQAPGVFAEQLAGRGYLALAFDYRYYGESEGEPRFYENPSAKVTTQPGPSSGWPLMAAWIAWKAERPWRRPVLRVERTPA